ncbi:MAG TPA: YbhB/YbcL family Raf kinase inhibitor-like protein [Polyangiaceae bacterium]|nr:YbhB/YbcL family Raf kinase inhibitor-like protein [Polyangiaceae bacterium]
MPSSQSRASLFTGRQLRTVLGLALLQGGAVLVACSSDNGDSTNPTGTAGTTAVAGGGNGSGGTATTAGTTSGGSAGSTSTAGSSSAGTAGSVATAGNGGSGGGGSSSGGTGGGGGGASGGSGGAAGGGSGGGSNAPFALTSTAFKEGEQVPLKYKCAQNKPAGENNSPPLSWGPGPAGTKSYAIILKHLPSPEHWVIWDIPANVLSLPENIEHAASPAQPAGAKQSSVNLDGFNGAGYLGPCPQAVNSVQQYQFTLYAMDVETLPGLNNTSTPAQAAAVVQQHLVAGSKGVSLTGTQIQMP